MLAYTQTELAKVKGMSRQGIHWGSKNGIVQVVRLPITKTNPDQQETIERYTEHDIVKTGSIYEVVNPCTLVPTDKKGDVQVTYYNQELNFDLPKGHKFFKK